MWAEDIQGLYRYYILASLLEISDKMKVHGFMFIKIGRK
jgi:hypothetical protein